MKKGRLLEEKQREVILTLLLLVIGMIIVSFGTALLLSSKLIAVVALGILFMILGILIFSWQLHKCLLIQANRNIESKALDIFITLAIWIGSFGVVSSLMTLTAAIITLNSKLMHITYGTTVVSSLILGIGITLLDMDSVNKDELK